MDYHIRQPQQRLYNGHVNAAKYVHTYLCNYGVKRLMIEHVYMLRNHVHILLSNARERSIGHIV